MFLLPCPSCKKPAEVAPTQAGDQVVCPSCGDSIQIPTLGELRKLPQTEDHAGISGTGADDDNVGRRIGFVGLSLISVCGLIIAVFCGLQWASVDAPLTTESYLQEVEQMYIELEPARLIREYEDMEKYGLAILAPYRYKVQEMEKWGWGRNAMIGAAVFVLCGLAALLLAAGRGSKPPVGADT